MPHFTYNTPDKLALKQGDIIKRTDELFGVIKEVHPYFASTNYSHFLILTQSCDLVKRGENCKSRYITICAIRSFEECLKREATPLLTTEIEKRTAKIIDTKNRSKLRDTVERILNNNHPDYFYLHTNIENGLTDPLAAFLRVSIALKSEKHYDCILKGKILELKDEFKAKLGWLVGNLYSRVGTDDWVPTALTKDAFNQMIASTLDTNFAWINNLKEVEKAFFKVINSEQLSTMSEEELTKTLSEIKIPSKKEKIIDKIREIMDSSAGKPIDNIILKIKNDPTLTELFK